jgi:sulfite reductase beta subunit-like hemoprotein
MFLPEEEKRAGLAKQTDELAEMFAKYRKGELTAAEIRYSRLCAGLYAQLPHVKHMQRTKTTGGFLTARQLEVMAEIAERFGRGIGHVTTRQNFQFHFLELEDTIELQRMLQAEEMNSRAACGHSVRTMTASHLAGIDPEEVFDISAYPLAATEYFLFHPMNMKLSRKFKIAFEGGPRDLAKLRLHEIGLYAAKKDGQEGWRIYCAGGTGSFPHAARLAYEFVPKDDLLIAMEALVALFFDTGNRNNIKKARFKFVVQTLGAEEFDTRVKDYFAKVEAERGAELRKGLADWLAANWKPETGPELKGGRPTSAAPGFLRWLETNTAEQKQSGYSYAIVKLPLGDVTTRQMLGLAEIARTYGNGNIRTAIAQNFVLPFVPYENLGKVYDELAKINLAEAGAYTLSDVTSCPGADYCDLAVTKSMSVAGRIRAHLEPLGGKYDYLGNLEVKVSGCPNGCGQHHVGDIGMTGMMVKRDGVETPHFSLMLGGGGVEADYQVGERVTGKYPEESAPFVVEALVQHYVANRRNEGESFKQYVRRVGAKQVQQEALGGIVAQYAGL